MSPFLLTSTVERTGTVQFLRLWASVTRTPIRGDAVLFDRKGVATKALSDAWRGAFGKALGTDQLVENGLPTKAFLDAWRDAVG